MPRTPEENITIVRKAVRERLVQLDFEEMNKLLDALQRGACQVAVDILFPKRSESE